VAPFHLSFKIVYACNQNRITILEEVLQQIKKKEKKKNSLPFRFKNRESGKAKKISIFFCVNKAKHFLCVVY
jgi:hypothetical protein